jgi:hypothetical protein
MRSRQKAGAWTLGVLVHYFITDETNKDFVDRKFFIYGGLVITDEQVLQVDAEAIRIRTKYGYQAGDSFKFHTRSRPAQVTVPDAKLAKQEFVESLERIGVRMIVYVILHNIARSQTDEVRMNWALNTVTWAFHRLIARENAGGFVLIDRDDTQYAHLANMFQLGLTMPDGRVISVAGRIKLFGQTADNLSHLSSAVDITLGAFRYCVNAAGGDGLEVVAQDILPPLSRMIWGVEVDGVKRLGGYGFIARPKTVAVSSFNDIYDELIDKLGQFSGGDAEEAADSTA